MPGETFVPWERSEGMAALPGHPPLHQWKKRPASITIVWPVVLSVRAKVTT
jgi:hypothetical protein